MAGETKKAELSLACTKKFRTRDGEQKENTEWVPLVYFGKQAEIIEQYVKKGMQLYCAGEFTTRSWDDKNTGEKKYRTEVRGIVMQMLGSKSDSGNQHQDSASASPPNDSGFASMPPAPEDDLPF
jgi:single-strand DNA-binding protein